MKITIFTPTYNRKEKIERLFNSLLKQKEKNFEWIIVDDGSTDNTKTKVVEFQNTKCGFDIVYLYTNNGGKHRALNKGIDLASGDLFFVVDSDDYLLPDATSIISYRYNEIVGKDGFAGICALRIQANQDVIGKTFCGEYVDCYAFDREKFGIFGDKAEIYFTDVIKKFKLPEIEGEKFISEEIYHYRIANSGLKLRYTNDKIYVCEYLNGGLTSKINKLLFDNYKGYTIRCKELVRYNVPLIRKIEVIGKYTYFGKRKKLNFIRISRNINVPLFCIIPCWMFAEIYFLIKKKEMGELYGL